MGFLDLAVAVLQLAVTKHMAADTVDGDHLARSVYHMVTTAARIEDDAKTTAFRCFERAAHLVEASAEVRLSPSDSCIWHLHFTHSHDTLTGSLSSTRSSL